MALWTPGGRAHRLPAFGATGKDQGSRMDWRPRLGGLAAIATMVALLAGCGGSSGLSRAQLVAKADAICATAQASASAVPSPSDLTDETAAAAYFDKIAPITDQETHDLSALKADGSAASDWNAFISAQTQANALLQTLKAKADAKDPSGQQDLARVTTVGDRVLATASKLGAATCAK
jgi:hypothetical protein